MTRTTVGVVGAGRIGRVHAWNLVHSVPEARVKAVASPHVDHAWAEGLGVPVHDEDNDVVWRDREIEAVVIAVPSGLHVEMITRAAEAGKQIFCEKPIAFEPEPIEAAQAAVKKAGVRLQVGFNRRFDPTVCRVRDAVQSGAVGALHMVRVTNRDPKAPEIGFVRRSGGLFRDFTIHDFDTVRFLSGSEIVEVYARGAALIDPALAEAGDIDTAVITLRLASGALGVIDNSRQTNYGYDQRFEAFGSGGSSSAENLRPTSVVFASEAGVVVDRPHDTFVERYQEAFVGELRAFLRSVQEGSPVAVDAGDALAAIRAAQAATTSMLENRPVQLAGTVDAVAGEAR
jgi:myo-inositol 2-dehydrogenase/D-chiro-inositol 1-dehydrogenase